MVAESSAMDVGVTPVMIGALVAEVLTVDSGPMLLPLTSLNVTSVAGVSRLPAMLMTHDTLVLSIRLKLLHTVSSPPVATA